MSWAEFKVRGLYLMTLFLIRKTIHVTLHPTKEFALSLVFHQALIFATKKARTTALERCLSISRVAALFPPECHIQVPKPNSVMKAEIPVKATLRLLSVTTMARKNSSEYFAPNHAKGFTDIGLARINQSIQAFCYSVLGAQANSHTSIIGDSGSAKNTQLDFLILVEDAIKTIDASNGPVKYQDAIERTKTRLDFAIAQGVLLMPSRMIINTESVVGYNNNLRGATDDMKLGVNNQVNLETKKASLKPMVGGPSKINPPNSHP